MLEICCGSFEDAWNAYQGGARRIELNSALFLGGLTPTTACLDMVKAETDLEVVCMVRPKERDSAIQNHRCARCLQRRKSFWITAVTAWHLDF